MAHGGAVIDNNVLAAPSLEMLPDELLLTALLPALCATDFGAWRVRWAPCTERQFASTNIRLQHGFSLSLREPATDH
jgi:hypothetical protein